MTRRKLSSTASRLVSWVGGSGLVVRLDGYLVEGSFLDRSRRSRDPDAPKDANSAAKASRRLIGLGTAAALIIALAFVIVAATGAASRSEHHQRRVADATFARVTVGMSPAQVRKPFGSRPVAVGTAESVGFAETCWTYERAGADYDICFQHGRVTSKARRSP